MGNLHLFDIPLNFIVNPKSKKTKTVHNFEDTAFLFTISVTSGLQLI